MNNKYFWEKIPVYNITHKVNVAAVFRDQDGQYAMLKYPSSVGSLHLIQIQSVIIFIIINETQHC